MIEHWVEIKIQNLWRRIHCNCFSSGTRDFKEYGGRGIGFYADWAEDYPSFRQGVLDEAGLPPSPEHSLDRIDNDGDYAPGNIRWATAQEQAQNRRKKIKPQHTGPSFDDLEAGLEHALRKTTCQ